MADVESLPSFADRFWSRAPGPETEDMPEPLRSMTVVNNFLTALDALEAGGGKKTPVLVAMLRRAEVEGDLSYASPEQLRGESLDARSIVFSLGVVLFERLTGRHPFGAENNRPRRLDRIRRGEMGSGVNSFPTIPTGLRQALVRAMSPFAEERFADLRELRAALRTAREEASAPKLPMPGATRRADSEDPTRVVRGSTDFGSELDSVVAEHEATPPPAPARTERPARGTPGRGLPAIPTHRQTRPRIAVPPPTPETPPPAAPRTVPPALAATTPSPALPEQELPSVVIEAEPPPSPAMQPLPRPPIEPPPVHEEVMQPLEPDLRLGRKMPPTVIGLGGALVGAAATLAVVFATRKNDGGAAEPPPAPSVAAPDEGSASGAASATGATAPDASAITVSPIVVDARPAPPAATSGRFEDKLAAAIGPCLDQGSATRSFGMSIVFRNATAGKAYFAAEDPITRAERNCISTAVRGLTGDGAPTSGDMLFTIRRGAQGMKISSRLLKR